jgi:hypothetical protein
VEDTLLVDTMYFRFSSRIYLSNHCCNGSLFLNLAITEFFAHAIHQILIVYVIAFCLSETHTYILFRRHVQYEVYADFFVDALVVKCICYAYLPYTPIIPYLSRSSIEVEIQFLLHRSLHKYSHSVA